MPSRAKTVTDAERRILAQIETHFPPIRARLETLEPLEAFALLGHLMSDTMMRFPIARRLQLAKSWTVTFMEAVHESLGIAKPTWRE